jgi:hypothetical protein
LRLILIATVLTIFSANVNTLAQNDKLLIARHIMQNSQSKELKLNISNDIAANYSLTANSQSIKSSIPSEEPFGIPGSLVPSGRGSAGIVHDLSKRSSIYISLDSWIYPALDRLASMGYLTTSYFGLRPWTRLSVEEMLEEVAAKLKINDEEAASIYLSVRKEVNTDLSVTSGHAVLSSIYTRFTNISGGKPLTSSFEFGQTFVNDFDRPYAEGFNAITGFQGNAEAGRFSFSLRGEYQHAPGLDPLPIIAQTVIASRNGGPGFDVLTPAQQFGVNTRNDFRLIDANLSYHLLGHEISVGKSEMWWGPNQGGAFLWSINAEPIYMFRINRVEPLYIPFLSRLVGSIRYDNFFGELKGHVDPRQPWVFGNKISIHPFKDLEFGFSRSCEFAGKEYSVLTFGTFWNCFRSSGDFLQAGQRKYDVGDRRGNFDFRWRLPAHLKSITIYSDSIADDDPSPLANPSRSSWAPGIYISHLPGFLKWDLRLEAPYTNSPNYSGGTYTNHGYRDGFTNKGQLIGYWVGRNSAAYQGWITYWLNPQEKIQFEYRDTKIDRSLWAAGGTQTDVSIRLIKRLGSDYELNGNLQFEKYLIPEFDPFARHNFSTSIQITWLPGLQKKF